MKDSNLTTDKRLGWCIKRHTSKSFGQYFTGEKPSLTGEGLRVRVYNNDGVQLFGMQEFSSIESVESWM